MMENLEKPMDQQAIITFLIKVCEFLDRVVSSLERIFKK